MHVMPVDSCQHRPRRLERRRSHLWWSKVRGIAVLIEACDLGDGNTSGPVECNRARVDVVPFDLLKRKREAERRIWPGTDQHVERSGQNPVIVVVACWPADAREKREGVGGPGGESEAGGFTPGP